MPHAIRAHCPRCTVALDGQLIRYCPRCNGSWISAQAFDERIAAMHAIPHEVSWRREARVALPCAACNEPMETLVVHATPVDRCVPHGIWFDASELGHVLRSSSQVQVMVATDGTRGTGRCDPGELGTEVAIEAIELVACEPELALAALEVATRTLGGLARQPEQSVAAIEFVTDAAGDVSEVLVDGVGVVTETVLDVVVGLVLSAFE